MRIGVQEMKGVHGAVPQVRSGIIPRCSGMDALEGTRGGFGMEIWTYSYIYGLHTWDWAFCNRRW